ncbi:MAG: lysoplasmalogenase family protein, partial [Actinomycetota bacterium]|nr:lysoplasmalogenase family protein [Actinomycetota bacterium]
MTVALLVLTGLVAVADWGAVVRARRRVEAIAKPLTLLLLIAAAGSADLGTAKPWVMLALGLGLLGDVALIYARERARPVAGGAPRPDAAFMIGLGCFLLGHLSYLVAFTRHGLHPWQVLAGALVAVGTGA